MVKIKHVSQKKEIKFKNGTGEAKWNFEFRPTHIESNRISKAKFIGKDRKIFLNNNKAIEDDRVFTESIQIRGHNNWNYGPITLLNQLYKNRVFA